MKVCLSKDDKVVFFTPEGRAVFDAPAAPMTVPTRRASRPPRKAARHLGGTAFHRASLCAQPLADLSPKWKCDIDIPWAVEAAAWEALESAGSSDDASDESG